MSEDHYSGAEGLFKRGRDAMASVVTTKATAAIGAIGVKALLGGLVLAKGAAVLAGKGALIALKAILLKLGLVVVIGTGGVALLGLFVAVILQGGAAGASGREADYRQASTQSWITAESLAPANAEWLGVSLEQFAVPWGLLEAIDMIDSETTLDVHVAARLLAPIARFRSTSITRVTVIPATPETGTEQASEQAPPRIVVETIPIYVLEHVSAWAGEYTYVSIKETNSDGSTFYALSRVDFLPNWDRLDNMLADLFNNTLDAEERDMLVSMGVNATYGEPNDILVLPFMGASTAIPVMVGDFAFPVAGPWRVTSPFGAFRGADGWHRGLDLGSPVGTPLLAVTSGTIKTLRSPRGGLMLFINADNGMRFLYAHLSGYAVQNGDRVNQGDVIGFVGNTGFSTGPHLHIEFILPDGTRIDPARYLIQRPR